MTWRLWHQDDNGNKYMIMEGDYEKLEAKRLEFEARGHKQLYWLQQDLDKEPEKKQTKA